jgi:malic enzyme
MDEQLKQSALDFHEFPVPGKIQVPTKPLATQRDLALAYSGVAAPAWKSKKIRWQPTNTPRAATWWRLSLTARRCWGWATSARWPVSR